MVTEFLKNLAAVVLVAGFRLWRSIIQVHPAFYLLVALAFATAYCSGEVRHVPVAPGGGLLRPLPGR